MTQTININIYNGGNYEQAIGQIDVAEAIKNAYDSAYPTSRSLDGTQDAWATSEYYQPTVVDGLHYDLVFLFDDNDMSDADGEPLDEEFFPWDAEHCVRAIRRYEDER